MTQIKLITECYSDFKGEFGDRKFRKTKEKLFMSKSFFRNQHVLVDYNKPISSSALIAIVANIPYFAFSNKRNSAIAAIMLLDHWVEFSDPYHEVLSVQKLEETVEEILMKCSKMGW